MLEETSDHQCHKDERWIERDSRGTPLVTVCPDCRAEKLAKFSRQTLEEPSYACEAEK
tara:strand:- start:25 stop:198 length:174 start_codon:yes stop_codon:yes gene_type:complete